MHSTRTQEVALTLVEMLVAISITTTLVLFLTQLINQTAVVTTLSNNRMDADSQARSVYERMALDFDHLIRRRDLSYYLKTAETPMAGNDLIGFYSAVQGFFPTTSSPVSVVAYRVNSDLSSPAVCGALERMGKGLDWNGGSSANTPLVFLPLRLQDTWPSVASSWSYDEADRARRTYELIGHQVFRLEYYYIEATTGNLVRYPHGWNSLSTVAIEDASAIVVAIAVIDSKARRTLSDSQIATVIERLPDYQADWGPGDLLAHWQSALDNIVDLPRPAIAGIRVYERSFPLSGP